MPRVFLGVGSNEGDRLKHISQAIRQLSSINHLQVVQIAPIIETKPVGGPPQENYLNTVVEVETTLSPQELLAALKQIEQQQGRKLDAVRWSSRPIDLDILLYGDQVIKTSELEVPHPRLHQRRFVLEPLAQLSPEMVHPLLKRSIKELLQATV